ncbi:MAG TPA: hypothetical protein VFZ78_06905 [Flavisolibacter sp.]
MKKILFLTFILSAITSTALYAQAGDPPNLLQQAKEKQVPLMVERTGLTEAQAERVVEINFEMRETMRGLGNISEAERAAKVAELKVARDKKYSEIPLTDEQIKSVKAFYESLGKSMPPKPRN